MGFFDKIKAAVGIGGAKIELKLDGEPSFDQGDNISGVLTLRGGKIEQKLNNLTIEVVQVIRYTDFEEHVEEDAFGNTRSHVHEHDHERQETLHTLELDGGRMISPEEEREYPFEITLPPDIAVTSSDTHWKLVANADIPGAIDPMDVVKFEVIPSASIQAVNEVMTSEFGFDVDSFGNEEDEGVWVDYIPTGRMKRLFDSVEISFYENDDELTLEMLLDLQERSFADVLSSMVGGDEKRVVLHIPMDGIWPNEETPDLDFVKEKLAEVFNRFRD